MTLEEIRKQIDEVDGQIREMFIRRMELADEVAQIKAQTEDRIYKPDREAQIIEKQSADMDPHMVMEYRALIRRIMEVSRKYQYGRTLQLRDCFPYSYETEPERVSSMVVIRPELYLAPQLCGDLLESGGQVHAARSWEEAAKLLRGNKADAGMGIIEHIGSGVSDELNTMLMREHLYIYRCDVIQDGDERLKVVTFSRKLVVRGDHNRLKLVFVTPNRSGALGSILSMISDYDVNLTEIHSIPFDDGQDWNYRFFVELSLNMLSEDARALVFQLSQETQMMQLLGSYRCEGDFVR